ncbi:hypothetical protein Pla52n_59100 [Stieleria varia]|uniref:Uncharacterized protein n=2 Tax=Stieleria varia TaxID=2528005 RepID=A0A5C6A0A5_9BACT|nr:hypothetical protein Pla52n_59100 [Stieleria varia]
MKFLVITQSDGKRRVSEHDCVTFDDLHSKLVASGVGDYRVFCEISDLVESLSLRVTALERRMDETNASSSASNNSIATTPNNRQRDAQPQSKMIKVELVGKSLIPENYDLEIYEDRIEFELRFHNISGDNIRAVKGDLVFSDLFDAEIFRIGITMNDPITPGKFATWSGGFPYNQFDREHAHFAGFKSEDLQLHLDNEKVVT